MAETVVTRNSPPRRGIRDDGREFEPLVSVEFGWETT